MRPGIELIFSTTITDGQNLFGQLLGPGDHDFSSSSFATKIFALGVCFDGYVGMDNPVSTGGSGGTSPSDPTLDPNGLSATPYVYLIPCGADSMRSPPLGDTSAIRTWNVDDVAIPLPFNIGASAFSATPFYTTSGLTLRAPLRGAQAAELSVPFRPRMPSTRASTAPTARCSPRSTPTSGLLAGPSGTPNGNWSFPGRRCWR